MTVNELITQLDLMPADHEVMVSGPGNLQSVWLNRSGDTVVLSKDEAPDWAS